MNEEYKQVYFNERQIEFVSALQKIKVWVGGRGSGKSAGLALLTRRLVEELPRGKYLFGSTTVEQIMNSTLPPVLTKLEEMGFYQDIHYVIGKRPLDWWDQEICHPYTAPKDYENVMTFFNGFTFVFVSTARPIGKRGGSYDGAIIDEAAFVKSVTFKKIIAPMVRDNLYRFTSNLHHNIFLLTSQPTTADGHYIFQYEEEFIADPSSVLFLWTSAEDNRLVLGDEWFEFMLKTMGYSDYLSEVKNERVRQLPNGFYHTFNRDKHGYRKTQDVVASDLLELSWDFGGNFNCLSVWQERNNIEYCVRRFHTKKDSGKVLGIVKAFTEAFAGHGLKYARIWGEPRGRDSNPYGDDDLFTIISKALSAKGWAVDVRVADGTQAKKHKERHFFFEEVFNENNQYLPKLRFNMDQCEDVVKSIEGAQIRGDFQKVKAQEDDPNFPQEWATHYTDTMDNYIVQKHYWKYENDSSSDGGDYDFL